MSRMTRRSALSLGASALGALLPGAAFASGMSPNLEASSLRFEVYRGGGGFRWRLKSGNNRVIATSGEGYRAKAACLAAINVIMQGASGAEIRDMT